MKGDGTVQTRFELAVHNALHLKLWKAIIDNNWQYLASSTISAQHVKVYAIVERDA